MLPETRKAKWLRLVTTRHKLIPLSLVRILYGLLMFVYFIQLYPDRDLLFSNAAGYYPLDGIWTRSAVLRDMLRMFDSHRVLDALFLVGTAAAFAFAVGFRTRLANILLYVVYFLLEGRNPLLFDAGDDFVQLSLLYLSFCQLNAHFSVDRLLRRREAAHNPYASIVHNMGMSAAVIQFLFIYVFSGLAKLLGALWRDGSAMGFVAQTDFYRMYDAVSDLLIAYPLIGAILTWAVLLFQSVFVFFVFVRRTRPWILSIAVCFHLWIAVQLGLAYFTFVMLTFELAFFSDADCRRALDKLRAVRRRPVAGRRTKDA